MSESISYRMRGDPEKTKMLMARKCMTRSDIMRNAGMGSGTACLVMQGKNVMPNTLGNFAFALGS